MGLKALRCDLISISCPTDTKQSAIKSNKVQFYILLHKTAANAVFNRQ